MKLTVCIVDDEPLAIEELEYLLADFHQITIIGTARSAEDAIKVINKTKPDIVFLDIQLKEVNAFSILESLKVKTHIIFVTAYDQYALRAFEVNALDYLLKPVLTPRLKDSIDRFSNKPKDIASHKETDKTYEYSDRIVLSEKNEYILININEISYIKSDGDYTYLKLINGSKKMILKSISTWESLLPSQYFEKIHRSTIVNMTLISRIEKGFNHTCTVYLQNEKEGLSMSQRFTTKFLTKYKV